MGAAPLVRLDGVTIRHSGRGPIGPIDLEIEAGEIVALVGASGCGKSTTLRLLAGLEAPDEGAATSRVAPGGVGLVFQSPTLAPWMSTLDNAALPLELAGTPRGAARDAARQALEAVGLGDRLTARPAQLSGGMAMRAALARALTTRPQLLLLDEPFAALDSVTRRRLIEDIHALWVEQTPAIVFVTHDVEEAAYMAGRILVMDAADGRIRQRLDGHGPLPRPPGWRSDPRHLHQVEAGARALADSMGVSA